jgi:hypothetical protein
MGELISAAPVSAPEPLREDHELGSFDSGEPSLDDWLVRRAKANQVSGASRTYVVRRGDLVVGLKARRKYLIETDDEEMRELETDRVGTLVLEYPGERKAGVRIVEAHGGSSGP